MSHHPSLHSRCKPKAPLFQMQALAAISGLQPELGSVCTTLAINCCPDTGRATLGPHARLQPGPTTTALPSHLAPVLFCTHALCYRRPPHLGELVALIQLPPAAVAVVDGFEHLVGLIVAARLDVGPQLLEHLRQARWQGSQVGAAAAKQLGRLMLAARALQRAEHHLQKPADQPTCRAGALTFCTPEAGAMADERDCNQADQAASGAEFWSQPAQQTQQQGTHLASPRNAP